MKVSHKYIKKNLLINKKRRLCPTYWT